METTFEAIFKSMFQGSQPTYKEWKQKRLERGEVRLESSQPTYKEWKRKFLRGWLNRVLDVPSLPTRNGNWTPVAGPCLSAHRSQPTYKEWKHR